MKIKKTILIVSLIIIVLIVVLLMLNNLTDGGLTGKQKITAFKSDPSTFTRIYIENQSGAVAFSLNGEAWQVEGLELAETESASINKLILTLSELTATKRIKSTDYADFGFSPALSTVTVTFKDGKTSTLLVGSEVPGGGYYVKTEARDDIFVASVSTVAPFLYSTQQFRNLTVFPYEEGTITEIEIDGTEDLAIHYDEAEVSIFSASTDWVMTSPIKALAENESVTNLILNNLYGAKASAVIADNVTDFSPYNLNTTLRITAGGKTDEYMIGSVEDGNYYINPTSSDTVYLADGETLSFIETPAFDILEKFFLLYYLESVKSLTATSEYLSTVLSVNREGVEEIFTIDGVVTPSSDFRKWYQAVASLSANDIAISANLGNKKVLELKFVFTDETKKTFSFYLYDGLNYSVFVDGFPSYTVDKTQVDKLISILEISEYHSLIGIGE